MVFLLEARKIIGRKSCYSLKHASRQWYNKFESFMCDQHYQRIIFFIIVYMLESSLMMILLSCCYMLMAHLLLERVFLYDPSRNLNY